jgi:hypothetical protein
MWKNKFARRRRRVDDAIAQRLETDATLAQLLYQVQQVTHRASQPIQPPDD